MMRTFYLMYGVVAYVIFFVTFLYAIGFTGNIVVPKSIDSGLPGNQQEAWLINILLLGIFAIQHSVMARQGFKKWWTKIIPRPIERSTYVLISSLALILLFSQWRPMLGIIWDVGDGVGSLISRAFFGAGWLMVLVATFTINHFDLFGLRQVYLYWLGKEYTPIKFQTTGFYKYLRHPIMLGFIVAFWVAPIMTVGHLLFAVATTAYMLIGIALEERDLCYFLGDTYKQYRQRVGMLIPRLPKE